MSYMMNFGFPEFGTLLFSCTFFYMSILQIFSSVSMLISVFFNYAKGVLGGQMSFNFCFMLNEVSKFWKFFILLSVKTIFSLQIWQYCCEELI